MPLNLTFYLPGNETINVKIDDTTQVKHLLANLKTQENALEPSKTYLVKTKSGITLADTSMFRDCKDTEYIIEERVEKATGISPKNLRRTKSFRQLGILVLDGSESMTWMGPLNMSKGKHVSDGLAKMFDRFEKSTQWQNFSFACIAFDHTPQVILNPVAFDYSTLMKTQFDPTIGKGGGTCIYAALEEAHTLALDFLKNATPDGLDMSVLILLMSDGECSDPARSIAVAQAIKMDPKIQIACAYFTEIGKTNKQAQDDLRKIASDLGNGPQFTDVIDGVALRDFFLQSITQSTGAKF